jgi:hypothetical protein
MLNTLKLALQEYFEKFKKKRSARRYAVSETIQKIYKTNENEIS